MKKNIKKISLILLIGIFIIGVLGCSKSSENKNETIKNESNTYESVKFTYSNEGKNYEVVVDKPIERAVTLSQFMTEMLLALGLEDKIAATALLDNPILPEFKEAYDKIPTLVIGEGHSISKESFVAIGADFVSGWDSSIGDKTTGTPSELIEKGIVPFMAKAYDVDATIETVYEDFELLGKIFGVEDKANEVIENMKNDVKAVTDKVSNVSNNERIKMMVYDSGENDAYVVGGGLANHLIKIAGGDNVYGEEATKPYIKASFESIVAKNPEVILVTDYEAGSPVEEKINFLKSHPALKDVEAIKNNKIYVVGLSDLSPGIRNPMVIEKMYGYFWGNNY